MSTISVEHHQPSSRQNVTLQHLTTSREEIVLLSHLLQASLVVERSNPLRQAITAHWRLVRILIVTAVVLLSFAIGSLAPSISALILLH